MWRGSWDDPRARATCGLRRIQGSRQTVLLARRAPTIKRWSLDARSEETICLLPLGKLGESEGPRPGKWHVSSCPVGERMRTSRAVGIIPATP
jgi:hypothetical protein